MRNITHKSTIQNTMKRIRNTPALLELSIAISLGLIIFATSFFIFWKMLETVLDRKIFLFDNVISMFFYNLRNPILTLIMQLFTFLGMDGILLLSVFIAFFLYMKKKKYEAVLFTIMIGTGVILNTVLKMIAQRTRPTFEPLVIERTLSFPSGHSMNSFIFFMTLAYFYYHFTHKKKSSIVVFLASAVFILCIGGSRIYLGVHYPSDVLGGYIAGLIWVSFVLIIDRIITFLRLLKTNRIR